jgi:hypothetical protein
MDIYHPLHVKNAGATDGQDLETGFRYVLVRLETDKHGEQVFGVTAA